MKIEKKKTKKIVAFLEAHKKLVGLSDYTVLLALHAKPMGDGTLATIDANIYEYTLKIELSLDFFKKNKKTQQNILLHELVHGRINVYNKKVEELVEAEEEYLANDLTRGMVNKK